MRRLVAYLTACVAVLVMAVSASADDALIAKQIITKLRQQKQAANLKGFDLGVQVDQGTVTMMGKVASSEQAMLALDVARRIPDVKLVVNDLYVSKPEAQQPVSTTIERAVSQPQPVERAAAQPVAYQQPALPQPAPQQRAARPVAGRSPVAFAASTIPNGRNIAPANYVSGGQDMVVGGGVADGTVVNGGTVVGGGYAGSGYGGGIVSENPSVPSYAWPSYAASPNYAAVAYPQQYSATAWPYIGPFYPYPQVPLGWRKVSLEWDDGWWFLDFTKK